MVGKFVTSSLIYVLGTVLSRGLSLFLLPLYSRHLDPDDYGVLAICTTVTTILGAFLSLSLENAVLLFRFQLDAESYRRFLRTVWVWLLVVPLAASLLAQAVGPALMPRLFSGVAWYPYGSLAVWIAYFSVASGVPLTLLRSDQRSLAYTGASLMLSVVPAAFIVAHVVFWKEGAAGSLRGQLTGLMIMAVPAHGFVLWRCRPWAGRLFDASVFRKAVRLCVPYVPHVLCLWALNLSDRWVLDRNVGLSDLGIYNLAYTGGSTIYMMGWGMMCAFSPMYYQCLGDPSSRRLLPGLTTAYVLLPTWASLALAVLAPELLRIVTRPAYYPAAAIVPWIALAYWCFVALYQLPMLVIEYHRKTHLTLVITGPSALVNIGLNLVFVPRFGVTAAAVDTVVGFAMMAALTWYFSSRLETMPVPWGAVAASLALCLLVFWGSTAVLTLPNLVLALALKGALLVASGAAMAYFGGVRANHVRGVVAAAARRFRNGVAVTPARDRTVVVEPSP